MTQGEMFSDLALEQQYDNMIKALDMKQTAVDWLFNRLWDTPKDKFVWHSLLKEAKEMEEGEIAVAYSTGTLDGVNQNFTNGYSYYEKTYKSK